MSSLNVNSLTDGGYASAAVPSRVSGTFDVTSTTPSGSLTRMTGSFDVAQGVKPGRGLGEDDDDEDDDGDGIGRDSGPQDSGTYNAGEPSAGEGGSRQAAIAELLTTLCKALGINPNQISGSPHYQGRGGGSPFGNNGGGSPFGNNGGGSPFGNNGGGSPYGHGGSPFRGLGGHSGNGGAFGQDPFHRGGGSNDNSYNSGRPSNNLGGWRGSDGAGNESNNECGNSGRQNAPDGSGSWKHGGNVSGPVKSYQNTGSAPNKIRVNNALDAAGATNKEKALILAMGEQEDHNFSKRDSAKDGQGDAKNYSPFNLNGYELRKLGYKGDPNRLNNPKNIGEAAQLLLKGIRDPNIGVDRLMDIHRGGQSADHGGGDRGDLERWRNGQKAAANAILQAGPAAFTDGSRYVTEAGYR